MINLFDIPNHIINTFDFTNLLHDKIVDEFTRNFCAYVGAAYGCPVNSASSAIFLISLYRDRLGLRPFTVPSVIPPVVLNSIINGGGDYRFTDDVDWVGSSYLLHDNPKIIDSAQEVTRNQCATLGESDIAIFSFYPTKPVGSIDGGMIVSNNRDIIDFFKITVMNGMQFAVANWERRLMMTGWKMYLNSVQAFVANENLKTLDLRKQRLKEIRDFYNEELGYDNRSDHLYRIHVSDNDQFLKFASSQEIICGIHYRSCHQHPLYGKDIVLPKSARESRTTVSIPYHARLDNLDLREVVTCIHQSGMLIQSN